MRPAITGDTAKGRSISVTNKLLPLKSNLVIDQAAATPKIKFKGTTINVTNKVSLMAESASVSVTAFMKIEMPDEKASENIRISGNMRTNKRNVMEIKIRPILIKSNCCRSDMEGCCIMANVKFNKLRRLIILLTTAPPLDEIQY